MCRNETPRNLAMQNIAQNYLVYIWHQFYNLFIKPIYIYMNNILYMIAVILIILWLFGFFMYSAGYLIHILLVIAVIAILVRVIKGDKL